MNSDHPTPEPGLRITSLLGGLILQILIQAKRCPFRIVRFKFNFKLDLPLNSSSDQVKVMKSSADFSFSSSLMHAYRFWIDWETEMLLVQYLQPSQNKVRRILPLGSHFSDAFQPQALTFGRKMFDILRVIIFTSHQKRVQCTSSHSRGKKSSAHPPAW